MAIDTYRSQGGSSVVLRPARRSVSGASVLGEGMAMLGKALGQAADADARATEVEQEAQFQVQQMEQRRQRTAAIVNGSGALADMQIALNERLATLPERQKPGATGYGAAAGKVVQEAADQFIATLPADEDVRQHFQPMLESLRAKTVTAAGDYERASFAKFQGDNFDKFDAAERNAVMGKPEAATLTESLGRIRVTLDAMDLDGTTRERLWANSRAGLTTALLDGLNQQGNWQGVKALVTGADLDGVLTPEQKKAYLRLAETGEAGAARAAEMQQAEVQAQAVEALRVLEAQQERGDDIPASRWESTLTAARQAGVKESDLIAWQGKAEDGLIDRQLRGLSTPVLEQGINTLRRKREAGQLTGPEARQLDRGEKALKDRDEAAGAKLGPQLKGGVEARMQGLAQLSAMPPSERWRAAEAAGEPRAAIEAALTPRGRAWAVQGAELRKARPDDFLPAKGAGVSDPQKEMDRVFRSVLGPGLVRDAGVNYAHLRDTALNVMAASGGRWDAENFRGAVQLVYGMQKRPDGTTQGGLGTVRGRPVELPQQWSEREFDYWYSRNSFVDAVYADGTPAKPADVRQNYTLQVDSEEPDGSVKYRLISPAGKPLGRKGKDGAGLFYVVVTPRPPAIPKGNR